MELKDKLVLVAGAGISGIGAVGLLKTAGAQGILSVGVVFRFVPVIPITLPFEQ